MAIDHPFCREEATRTPDPYVPNVVRYQLRYFSILRSFSMNCFAILGLLIYLEFNRILTFLDLDILAQPLIGTLIIGVEIIMIIYDEIT